MKDEQLFFFILFINYPSLDWRGGFADSPIPGVNVSARSRMQKSELCKRDWDAGIWLLLNKLKVCILSG